MKILNNFFNKNNINVSKDFESIVSFGKNLDMENNHSIKENEYLIQSCTLDGYEGILTLVKPKKSSQKTNDTLLVYFQSKEEDKIPFQNGQIFAGTFELTRVFDSQKREYQCDTCINQNITRKNTPYSQFVAKVIKNLGNGIYEVKIDNFSDNVKVIISDSQKYEEGDLISGRGYLTANFDNL